MESFLEYFNCLYFAICILLNLNKCIVNFGVRFDYGIPLLEDGIKLVPALIGLFALSEMINLAVKGGAIAEDTSKIAISRISDGVNSVLKNWSTMLVGSAYGTFIGAVPGVAPALRQASSPTRRPSGNKPVASAE